MKTITSPYNFVPMAETVHIPAWQNVSQDGPLKDGLSGTIEYELRNATPLMVGDQHIEDLQHGTIVEFFKTPDNHYAIPGTSLKGMIRNWLEIATHSRLSMLNDHWLSYRDLRNKEYTKLLTDDINGTYKAKSQAGWLRFEDGEWKLYPAKLWRVENREIEKLFNIRINDKEAEKIYQKLGGIQPVNFEAEAEKVHTNHTVPLIYAAATQLKKADPKSAKGYLIVTGQMPGPKKPKPGQSKGKHMNFIFSPPAKDPLSYENPDVLRRFLDINKDREDFNYLKKLNHPYGIPVFYIPAGQKVSQMGMAQMFRFPYNFSVAQLRSPSHQANDGNDFTQLLFGDTENEGHGRNQKGRVSFSLAKAKDKNITPELLPPTVLGGPKNSFYPAYIDQHRKKGGKKFATYNQADSRLSGFKRYAVHKDFNRKRLPSPPNNNFKVAVQINALPEGQLFTGKVRFHNLNQIELGALLYAITLDNQQELYHQLGMGKPYGLGKVKFENVKLTLADGQTPQLHPLIEDFTQYAEKEIQSKETIYQLFILQNEKTFNESELKYLEFPTGFIDTVKSGAKLPSIKEKAQALAKKKEAERQERIKQQKIKEAQEAQRQKLNQKSEIQLWIDDNLGGKIDKAAIKKLSDDPRLWQALSEEGQQDLAREIKRSEYYKNANTKLKKKIRSNLGDLGEIVKTII